MTESLLPQLENPETRKALLEAIFALFERWHLHEVNQAQLLGVENLSELKQEKFPEDATSILENTGQLLAIDRALLKFFPYEPTARDQWIFVPRSELGDETPLNVMLEQGTEGIRKVRELAEALLKQ